jgi:hypothetical protein
MPCQSLDAKSLLAATEKSRRLRIVHRIPAQRRAACGPRNSRAGRQPGCPGGLAGKPCRARFRCHCAPRRVARPVHTRNEVRPPSAGMATVRCLPVKDSGLQPLLHNIEEIVGATEGFRASGGISAAWCGRCRGSRAVHWSASPCRDVRRRRFKRCCIDRQALRAQRHTVFSVALL